MRNDRDKIELAVAFHEAGHAVVAYALGYEVDRATIVPNPDDQNEGCVSYTSQKPTPYLTWAVKLAGPVAQSWITNALDGCNGDYEGIDDLWQEIAEADSWPDWPPTAPKGTVLELGDPGAGFLSKYRAVDQAIRERIDRLRPQIEEVALTLLVRKKLTGDEIEAIVDGMEIAEAA